MGNLTTRRDQCTHMKNISIWYSEVDRYLTENSVVCFTAVPMLISRNEAREL